jgi:hypothetical protein
MSTSLNEGFLSRTIKGAADFGGIVSGTRLMADVEANTTEDAWLLFKAIVGPGTDEQTIKEVMTRRKNDLKKLNQEWDDLIKLSLKSTNLAGKDFDKINPTKMDMTDFADAGSSYFFFAGLLLLAMGWGMAGAIISGMGWLITKGLKDKVKRDQDEDREESRKSEKKNYGIVGKLLQKLRGTIQDKPLAWYLRDDGEDDWADYLERGIKGEKVDPATVAESRTLRLVIRETINKN